MNRRPLFYNTSFTTDAGGGPTDHRTDEWYQWADIADRTGNTFAAQATQLTQYDYRVRVRFDGRFNSNTWMVYEGQVCKCQSLSIETEGVKDFLVLRYSKTDTFIDMS